MGRWEGGAQCFCARMMRWIEYVLPSLLSILLFHSRSIVDH
jgi:hypothetical protein